MLERTSTLPPAAAVENPRATPPRWSFAGWCRTYGIVLVVLALFVVLSLTSPNFFSWTNFRNILDQNAFLGVAAFGATVVIIAGGFDLSAGAVFALGGVVAAWVAVNIDPGLGLIAGIGVGVVLGFINGLLTSLLGAQSFLITLASGIVATGVAVAISGGFLINASEYPSMTWLAQGKLLGLPPTIWVLAITGLLLSFVLVGTNFGRRVFAVGGSREAARLAGVRVGQTIIGAFMISGAMASLAGLLVMSRAGQGQADAAGASTLALEAIATVIIGGTSIKGGRGSIWRTALGVALVALIGNGMNLLNFESQWQDITMGLVILLAVALNVLSERRR